MPTQNRLCNRPRAIGWRLRGLVWLVFLTASWVQAAPLHPLPWAPEETLRRLKSLLDVGELVWLELNPSGQLVQTTLVAQIPTSSDAAYRLVQSPPNYKRMSPSVESITVLEESAAGATYDARVQIPFGSLRNVVKMSYYPPNRIENTFVDGDMRTGNFRWWFIPDAPARSAVIYTLKTDVRETNWAVRQVVKLRPETQHGGNAGAGLITVWGLKRLVLGEKSDLKKQEPSPWARSAVELPLKLTGDLSVWHDRLKMLERGPLIQVESTPGGRLKRITAYARVMTDAKRLLSLASDPMTYSRVTSHVKEVSVVSRKDNLIQFRSVSEFMKLRYAQDEELRIYPDRVTQRAMKGDLEGAAGQLEVASLGPGLSIAAYSYYMDPSKNGWVMRQIFAIDPLVEHIFAISGGFGILNGLAREAEGKPPLIPEER